MNKGPGGFISGPFSFLRVNCSLSLFLLGRDEILQGFGGEGFDDLLGRDFDGGAGLGVAADAGLAGSNLDRDESGDGELVSLFNGLGGQIIKSGKDYSGLLLGNSSLFSEVSDDLGFGHGHGLILLLLGE